MWYEQKANILEPRWVSVAKYKKKKDRVILNFYCKFIFVCETASLFSQE